MRAQPPSPPAVEWVATERGHFGELLQGRLEADGPLALVTLPCAAMKATARFRPDLGGALALQGAGGGAIARRAAEAVGRLLGGSASGRLTIETTAPLGGGCGSSTLSALTTLRAVAAARGAALTAEEAARICLDAEGAVDPLMHGAPGRLLWAPRAARILATLPPPPPLWIAGGFDGPGRATDPADLAFPNLGDAAERLGAAFAAGDAAAVGAIASGSAVRNQRRNPKRTFAAVEGLAGKMGAVGLVAAHTGSALGLLFAAPPADPERLRARLAEIGLASPLISAATETPRATRGGG